MKLLLDTHIFIWWTSEPSKFLPQAIILLDDPSLIIARGQQ